MTDKKTLRDKLYATLGDLPDRNRPVSATLISEESCGSYVLETLTLDLNGIEPVPAYFTKPIGGTEQVVVYHHSHGGRYDIGKNELIASRDYMHSPSYAEALADMGISALCIDMWNFGERGGRTESSLFKEMLWKGQVLWGMMVYDAIRSVDYLFTRNDIDTKRIGTLGMSMGSTMAWWLAAIDERISVCVDICCLTDFDALIEANGLDGHGIYYFVPGLLKEWTTGKINSLIAPRPHLAVAGNYDRLTPVKGLDRLDRELKEIYEQEGAPEAWKLSRYPCGHIETRAMRREVMKWLAKWMGRDSKIPPQC